MPRLTQIKQAMTPGKLLRLLLAALWLILPAPAPALEGRVVDARSGQPVAGAFVTFGAAAARTDAGGRFRVDGAGARVGARAHGYGRSVVEFAPLQREPLEIRLAPLRPKALYLSFYGIADRALRQTALDLAERTEINALVIDVKGDHGLITYRSAVPLAAAAGAQRRTTVADMRALMQSLRDKGLYLIARIVVFKDTPLATARPELAVRKADGALWRDREGLAWVDPFRREAWDYNIAIAADAAANGFDEIQFDYVRFPDAPGLVYSQPNTEANRIAAITGFLAEARQRLAPYNVFLAVDVFGYVCWNTNDTFIGQKLEALAAQVDYVSPMLYPSGFQDGIPGYRNPVSHPGQIVGLTLERARQRTHLPAVRFRPWLQAFKDYAFDKRRFSAAEIRAQIDAAERFGSAGWMLWNPRNIYSDAGLNARTPAQAAKP